MNQIMSMITHIPSTSFQTRLATFNTLAASYQDEAYTLAFYLLGDEDRATEATRVAFSRLYEQLGTKLENFRTEALRWVVSVSRQSVPLFARALASKPLDSSGLIGRLLALSENERCAVVLVDILGLRYEEAAQVLGSSRKQVGSWVAQARLNLQQS